MGLAATSQIFYIEVLAFGGDGSSSEAAISGFHTNVIRKRKNGQTLLQREEAAERESPCDEKSLLSIEGALEFADTVELDDVRALVQRQIDYNYAIAQEGLWGNYGANIGSVLLKHDGDDVKVRAKAYAAAGSDARMNGCELPVVIVSGSGNQGITASVPVVVYAKELGASEEKMLRAVVLSDLITIHQKSGIGRLSAYCGAISAGCGAGAGIAYLYGGAMRRSPHGGERTGGGLRRGVRRRQGILRGQDRRRGGRRYPGLLDVPGWKPGSLAGTESSPRAWKIPFGMLAAWPARA